MAKDTFHARPDAGKTFTVAMWLLGMAAAAQVLAVGWAVVTRPSPEDTGLAATSQPDASVPAELDLSGTNAAPAGGTFPDNALAPTSATVTDPPASLPVLPPMPQLIDPDEAPPPRSSKSNATIAAGGTTETTSDPAIMTGPTPAVTGENLLPTPRFTGPETPAPLSTVLSQAALQSPPALVVDDPAVGRLIETGAERRASGDMQGALDSLRQAEAILPEHPRVLAEIAATYGEMGIVPRSSLYWEKVQGLGPENAGPWFDIAVGELTGSRGGATKAPSILRLGRVTAAHDKTVTEGEKVVLSVIVEADPAARPNAKEMAMLVYFYDLVDGENSEASTADTSQEFPTPPYDWIDNGRETIEVTYFQPPFTEEQKRELGERKYYGYIIELYYRDELQDTTAFPPELNSLDPNAPPSPLTEPPIGPDNSLFPTAPSVSE
ncbi:MAG: hypothetical protein KDN19_14990 [Verrucomicrobiae bacterium]|nr:hypothetical protein [Verrucomicrobiae bacterium]